MTDHCNREQLAAYCAAELSDAERAGVELHLAACPRCWDEVRVSRAAAAAVERLWERAPVELYADVRAAVAGSARPDQRGAPMGRAGAPTRLLLVAAAVAVALALVGLSTAFGDGPDRRPVAGPPSRSTAGISAGPTTSATTSATAPAGTSAPPSTTQGTAAPVLAAVRRFGATPPRGGDVPTGPDLRGVGLREQAAGALDVGGVAATVYVYLDASGDRLEIYVGRPPWARPEDAASAGTSAWMAQRGGLTLIGGPDTARDQMLVITPDHATAVSAAASLGIG